MKTVPTFSATIWVGTKERATGQLVPIETLKDYLQSYCDRVGFCVSITPTEFIYKNGGEPGIAVGLINYPRFPSTPEIIRQQALEIACDLMVEAKQLKVSVVFPDETVMLGGELGE